MSDLVVSGLCAGYGRVQVVRDIDLTVASGEVVALLGANGAGKTTTLLGISGLCTRFSGDVRIGGSPVRAGRPHEAITLGLAHVPEDRSLFESLTVDEHLRLAARPGAMTRAWIDSLVPVLTSLRHRKAGLLSGGEQQMLAVARALIGNPRILVVDELSLGLAPIVVEHILDALTTAAGDAGLGVLLVEQHAELALRAASRAVVMRRGSIVHHAPAAELLAAPEALEALYLGEADEALTPTH